MGTNQTEEKTGYPEWLELLRLMEPEDKKEREAMRTEKEKTEKKAKKPNKAKKVDRSVRRVVMSRGTALVMMPPGVRDRAGLGRGVHVRVRWDEGLQAIVVNVINAANFQRLLSEC